MKKLRELCAKVFGAGTYHLYKGFCVRACREGYIVRPFGKGEIYLGKTLRNASMALEQMLQQE